MLASRGILAVVLGLLTPMAVLGQYAAPPMAVPASSPSGPVAMPASPVPGAVMPAVKGARPGPKPPEAKKGKPGDPKKEGEKKEDKSGKDKEPPKTITRPTKPPEPPNPDELKKARLGADGRVEFQFKGQPWPEVIQWLADLSGKNFHWQEAPGGYLNLTTSRRHTVDEVRDLLNRRLLDCGYVLLCDDEDLSLVNLKKLDPSRVPRVAPEELKNRQPHDWVKVSFRLDQLMADTAVEEIKPMKSPTGSLTAMSATNCIEAMDAVVNLREIAAVLAREQETNPDRSPPRVFPLTHRRATEVLGLLETLLGRPSSKGPAAPASDQARQMAEQMARMQAAQQGNKPGQPAAKPKTEAEVYLVADDRNHCIIAQAPPDKMAMIDRAIRMIDVRGPGAASAPGAIERMHIYHLSAIDPEPLVRTLQEIGNLDLDTRLEIDRQNKAIIAYASLADHATIRALIEKLDVGGRGFHVIPLRQLRADAVADTIRSMIFGGRDAPDKKKTQQSRYWYDPWDYSSRQESSTKPDQFRVDADVERNVLWLWANDLELEEVHKLLAKLGEVPSQNGRAERVRVLDAYEQDELQKLLERVRQAWPGVNPLEIDVAPETPSELPPAAEPEVPTGPPPAAEPAPEPKTEPAPPVRTATRRPAASEFLLAQLQSATPATSSTAVSGKTVEAAGSRPAVKIMRNPAGRLVIASEDTEALDLLEDLIGRLAPPRKNYHIFRITHASAYDVAYNLESFFKEDGNQTPILDWWGDIAYTPDESANRTGLSKRRPLKFIVDPSSNTILVQGADSSQMRQIKDLIEIYDQAEPTDSQNVRQTSTFALRWSKAQVVAGAIKEVYRDLLSENDKAFSRGRSNQDQSDGGRWSRFGGGGSSGGSSLRGEKTPRFKGLLSIGVDEMSNTLIVSAPPKQLAEVGQLIRTLDVAAEPVSAVRVVKVGRGVSAERLRQVLTGLNGQGPALSPQPKSSGHHSSSSTPTPGAAKP